MPPLLSKCLLQTQLGVMSRAQSVSSYAVGACGQALLACGKTAIDDLDVTAGTLQSQVQPYTDGIIVSSSYANALTTFAFSATSDPGFLPILALLQQPTEYVINCIGFPL